MFIQLTKSNDEIRVFNFDYVTSFYPRKLAGGGDGSILEFTNNVYLSLRELVLETSEEIMDLIEEHERLGRK